MTFVLTEELERSAVPLRSALLDLLNLHVHGNGDVSHASGSQSCADREIGHAFHMGSAHDSLVVDRHIHEELIQCYVLLGKRTNQIAVLKSCDRKNRSMIHLRVVEPIQEMNTAGTGGGNTHPELAREFRVGARHKGSSLFMPHVNESYPLLLLAERLEDSIDAIAWKTEYGVDPPSD